MKRFDLLTRELLRLKAQLPTTPFLVGGGMGLYLRSVYFDSDRSPRYSRAVPTRSTQDIDMMLSGEVIADDTHMREIRDALQTLGYEVRTPNFQFVQRMADSDREVEVDLLTAPPHAEDETHVKISGFRVRPVQSKGIHAYLTKEARSIDRGAVRVDVSRAAEYHGVSLSDPSIYIPSSFNYLILKLHAFHDRKDHDDEKSDEGRHHALYIFTTVTDMSAADWENAKEHFEAECTESYIQKAIAIQQQYFSKPTALGILRIQENQTFRQFKSEFEAYLPDVINDLNDLFTGC